MLLQALLAENNSVRTELEAADSVHAAEMEKYADQFALDMQRLNENKAKMVEYWRNVCTRMNSKFSTIRCKLEQRPGPDDESQ